MVKSEQVIPGYNIAASSIFFSIVFFIIALTSPMLESFLVLLICVGTLTGIWGILFYILSSMLVSLLQNHASKSDFWFNPILLVISGIGPVSFGVWGADMARLIGASGIAWGYWFIWVGYSSCLACEISEIILRTRQQSANSIRASRVR
jgi:hypothetical protein